MLSRGTTHKPPPLDTAGFPIDESMASARYLVERGVAPARVLLESWSLDTIGNAAFARLMHSDVRGWRRIRRRKGSDACPTRARFSMRECRLRKFVPKASLMGSLMASMVISLAPDS